MVDWTRRSVLATGAALASSPVLGSTPEVAAAPLDSAAFLRLSQAATGHRHLDPTTARRMLQLLSAAAPDAPTRLVALFNLVRDGADPQALLAAADGAGLKDLLMTIVRAWYTGSVGDGMLAPVVSFADALMYRAVDDAIPPPTYCLGGPLWWTAAPPPEQRVERG